MSEITTNHHFIMETEGSTHFARLARLILQEGTNQIRINCLKNIIDDKSLAQILAIKKNEIQVLKTKGIINDIHFSNLYPQNCLEPKVDNIDLTLWIVLIRNITKGKNQINWTKPPTAKNTRWQHHALRLREVRNRLFHLPLPELTGAEFRELWDITSGALSALGTPHEVIIDYYNKDLDPLQTKLYALQVREQVLQELYGVMTNDAQRRRQLKIVIPVAILVALIISVTFVVPLVVFLREKPSCSKAIQGLRTDMGELQFFDRQGWGAESPTHTLEDLRTPVANVVILHTALIGSCSDVRTCCDDVKRVQHYNMHSRQPPFNDIAYNFLVGGDGVIYEGRGWNKVSAALHGWNKRMISIAFIGDFIYIPPTPLSTLAVRVFIDYMVDNQKVIGNYSLYAHCQLNPKYPNSPGEMVYKEMRSWKHFIHVNHSNCRGDNL